MKCPECGKAMSRHGSEGGHQCTKPAVAPDECIGCGICVSACPFGAISMIDGKAVIDHEKCTGCNKCIAVCPVNAISIE